MHTPGILQLCRLPRANPIYVESELSLLDTCLAERHRARDTSLGVRWREDGRSEQQEISLTTTEGH